MTSQPHPPSPPFLREWLVANSLGGYAMGAIDGACRQTHHALLVMPIRPPLQRVMFVRQLDEALLINGRWENVATAAAPDSSPRTRVDFHLDNGMPHFKISCGNIAVLKTLWMPQQGQSLCVRYETIGGDITRLRVTPGISFRALDTGKALCDSYLVRTQPHGVLVYADPSEKPCGISATRTNALYTVNTWKELRLFEPSTGGWQSEEVYLPAALEFDLLPGSHVTLMLQIEDRVQSDHAAAPSNTDALHHAEMERQRMQAQELAQTFPYQPMRHLAASASHFVIERATATTQNGRTILAGYPRLNDWGRDAMIALPGLLLAAGRFSRAKEVFAMFIKHLNQGLIPNYFSSRPEPANYDSSDATLWMFVALYEYWRAAHDQSYIEEVYPLLLEILQGYIRGSVKGVKLDPDDGLLFSLEPRASMTWMNAQVGDWQATARHGKAVEVQALWHNALRIMAAFSEALGKAEGIKRCGELAEHTGKSLRQKFWCEETSHLFDCLIDTSIINATGKPSRGNKIVVGDPALRPNQIIAVGLPFNVFAPEQTRAVVEVAARKLVTPYGLRTLTPDHPAYCGEYSGSLKRLASACHNGCVYPWLVLFFTRAYMSLDDNPRALYEMFEPLFSDAEKHCPGHLAEMYDGNAPHHPRGAAAYAASTGAILQSWQIMQGKSR